MHLDLEELVEVPEGIEIEYDEKDRILTLKGPKGELSRKFPYELKIEGRSIRLYQKNATKSEKKIIKSAFAHVRNMIKGVTEGYNYSLQICTVHFPMNVAIQKGEVVIKNFLGESKERKAKILPKVEAKIEGDFIRIFSVDKEAAGQTAANIEVATKVKKRDRRVFQDGIWIVEKPEGSLLA